jgi:hypothetical protein
MQENLREFVKKIISAVKTVLAKAPGGIVPIVMLLSVGIIALTQESPFQVNEFDGNNEEIDAEQDVFFIYESPRPTPEWVKPARWFRSNSGGMPLEEMKSSIAAMRSEYALVIDFTNSYDLPEYLLDYYDDQYFIEIRTLYKDGKEDRIQWIFRDEDFGIRFIAVIFEAAQGAEQEADDEKIGAAPVEEETAVAKITDDENIEDLETKIKVKQVRKRDPASGFIEIYDEKYHITEEYRYSDKGEKSKIEYFYNDNIKTSALTMLWDEDEDDYVQVYTDYYRYNRSSFLRAVERVFLRDQQITSVDNVIADNAITNNSFMDNEVTNNIVKVSFPQNILAAARNELFMGERINSYPEFFGDLVVLKDSRLVFTTDNKGKVLDQTLISNDEEKTVIWKIVNTWSDDRIVKITKTEGETALVAEYVYNKKGDRVLERNIKDGVLERVVRSEGKTDIEELYLDDKIVLKAVWEDGRKISESRIIKN